MDAKTIAAKRFTRTAFGGYKSDDVDAFFQEVVTYVTKLEKDLAAEQHNVELLAGKVEEYRGNEEAVQFALVKAQKIASKTINDAKLEAEEIIDSAKAEAEQIEASANDRAYNISTEAIEETEALIRELKNKALTELNELKQKTAIERKTLENAKMAASEFKTDLFELYRIHLDAISRIPAIEETDYQPEGNVEELPAAEEIAEEDVVEAEDTAEPEMIPVVEEAVASEEIDETEAPAEEFPPADESVKNEDPIAEEVTEEPVVEEVTEEIVAEEVTEEPVAEEAIDEPVAEEAIDEPVVEEAIEEPVVEDAVEEPVAEEAVEESVVEEVIEEPTVEVVIEESIAEEAVEEPTVEVVIEESKTAEDEPEEAFPMDDNLQETFPGIEIPVQPKTSVKEAVAKMLEREKAGKREPKKAKASSGEQLNMSDMVSGKKSVPQNDSDTRVIPVKEIDGDEMPEDVRRTMQNVSKRVYGRKFTDLKFGGK